MFAKGYVNEKYILNTKEFNAYYGKESVIQDNLIIFRIEIGIILAPEKFMKYLSDNYFKNYNERNKCLCKKESEMEYIEEYPDVYIVNFLENLIKDTEQLLYSKGAAKVDSFCIVLTNDSGIETSFGKEGSLVKNYSDVSMDYWLVDVQKNNIMIFEDEPEDFHGIYNCLQAVLEDSYEYRNVNRSIEDKIFLEPDLKK